MYLGLDFGTTSTVISVASEDGGARVLAVAPCSIPKKFREGFDHVIPSTISFRRDGQVLVGAEVLAANQLHAENTFRWMKPYLTGVYRDPPREVLGEDITNAEAARKFLHAILIKATRSVGPISKVCATTPVAAFAQYQEWLGEVIRDAGLPRPSFVDEPTAAAVCVAGNRGTKSNTIVVDFGGGTLDIAVVARPAVRHGKLSAEKIKVLGSSGTFLGGREIDAWLAQMVQKELGLATSYGQDFSLNELLINCEAAKELLTSSDNATVACISASDGSIRQMNISRAEFDGLLRQRGLFERIRDTLAAALSKSRENGVSQKDITEVILVGGSTLIPSVGDYIKEQFPSTTIRSEQPFAAVSLGAARIAAGHPIEPRTFHEYAIRYQDQTGKDRFEVIVPAGQPIPSRDIWSRVITSTVAGQTLFNIEVYQRDVVNRGLAKKVTDIMFGRDGKAILGTSNSPAPKFSHTLLQTNGVIAAPSAHEGERCLRAQFDIDENRCLLLTVDDIRKNPESRLMHRVAMVHLGS